MRNAIMGILAAAAVIFVAPRSAKACGQGSNYGPLVAVGIGALAVGAVDTGMFIVDGVNLLAGQPMSHGYAAFEIIWTAPQAILGAAGTISITSKPYYNSNEAWGAGIY